MYHKGDIGNDSKRSIKNLDEIKKKINSGARIWSLLFLELWHRMFVDGEKF